VCFNSKAALVRFAGRSIRGGKWRRGAASGYAKLAPITWAIDDSSGQARGYRPLRLDGLRELRSRLRPDA
jgi:hypothetical protein